MEQHRFLLICWFGIFLLIGFGAVPLMIKLFVHLQVRIGNGERNRLNFGDGGRRIGPARLDDRESSRLAEHIHQIGSGGLGNHDHRTQKRHFEAGKGRDECDKVPDGC